MANIQTYRISIPSRTDHLFRVRNFVSDLARAHGFGDDDVNKISIAVDEACTNIIKHGYNFSPDHEIEIEVRRNDRLFEILISDNGKQFDPNTVETPNMKEYLTHYRRGGLGLYLMKRIMDKVEFHFSNERNTLHMVKSL
ncbi:MAG: ATP-binding protein [Bacteroidota bacterium]